MSTPDKQRELTVETWPINNLKPYSKNPRVISDAAVGKVAASIREYGFQQPVVVDKKGTIIVGHTRLQAAKKLGLTEVPVHVARNLTPKQAAAYRLMDNRSHEEAAWDTKLLGPELMDLQNAEFDLSLTGFDEMELGKYLALMDVSEGLTDPDDVPETPEKPITQPGDVWTLGKHRLVCGDCTDADTVAKCLNGVEPHLMVTDPPYGVEYDADWRNRADRANGKPYGASAVGKVENDDRADWREAWALFPGDVAYVWHADQHANIIADSLIGVGLFLRAQIIWVKNNIVISRGDYHPKHEPCWYAVRKGRKGHYSGGRKQTTVWEINKPQKSETGHSTQKPVECMKRPIENNSSPGQAVYEPFCGSGTTIIAAEMTGRICHAIEISPAYCDVIVKRWEDFTGKTAQRKGDGAKIPSIKSDAEQATTETAA